MAHETLFNAPLPPEVEALFAGLAADEEIRAMAAPREFATTRGDYGRYMSLLARLAATSPLAGPTLRPNYRAWAVVLVRAGADRRGVSDALMVLGA